MTSTPITYGTIRAVPASEYRDGAAGYLIEMYSAWNGGEGWAIPAWDERGASHLEGPFETLEAANDVIREAA